MSQRGTCGSKIRLQLFIYSISFLSVIPLSQLLAHKYKIKDTILTMLTNQIEVEESILAELNELVFLIEQKQADMLALYYGAFASKTNISLGSGLEGYLAKKIIDTLHIPLKIITEKNENHISFLLQIHKEKK